MKDGIVGWRVRAIRGATTVSENSIPAIREAVHELLDAIETHNDLNLEEVVSVTFSVTRDLDRIFPAAIARERPHWQNVALLDVQQMHVEGALPRCIRCLIHFNTPVPHPPIHHAYLRQARDLRPDWDAASTPAFHSTARIQ
uniref:chorismate mutase n=1 Tax=Cyanothece sp. (strain PCC 7425 / ATCC 29141) TaxID=395961 RepID=B8HM50_CYAP4